jgi:hypothetical protein
MSRPTAVYEVSGAARREISTIIKIHNYSGLKEFVVALVNAATDLESNSLSREQLTDALERHIAPPKKIGGTAKSLSSANSMVSRRVKELESLGCMRIRSEYRTVGENKRKFTVHELISLAGLIDFLNQPTYQSPSPQGRPKINDLVVYSDLLEDEGIIKLEANGDVVPYTEGAFSILESAARSRSDKENVVKCKYYIKKDDYIDITASTSTKEDSGIMYSSDQRVIHALNGMLKQANDEKQADLFSVSTDDYAAKLIGEYCFFDLYALTREIGLVANVKENRLNVLKMIGRLKDTTYAVDATNSKYWRERYMPGPTFNKGEYRYITEFYSAEDWCKQVGKGDDSVRSYEDRFFVVKFHQLIFKAMTTPRLAFISHEGLKKERLDIVQRLNNWIKPVVGVRDKKVELNHHQYTLDIFHQRVRPASRLDNFERQFIDMVKRQDKLEDKIPHEESVRFEVNEKGELILNGTFWLNGYYYKIEQNDAVALEIYRKTRMIKKRRKKIYPVITLWRDRKDQLVGDDSVHNRALRRQMDALLQDGDDISENNAFNSADYIHQNTQQYSV